MATHPEIGKPNAQNLKRPASLVDKIEIWFSTHKYIDRLWIGTWEDNADSLLRRVEGALGVIKIYDPLRYDRIRRDLERVWVRALFGNDAEYNHAMKACELDVRFVRAATSSPTIIASIIVHEATHARILNRRIPYDVALRDRVEAVCVRREQAFAKRLPNGLDAQGRAERLLEMSATAELWTDEKFRERHAEGVMGVARHVGVPIWIAHFLLCCRDLHTEVKRRVRRLFKTKKPQEG